MPQVIRNPPGAPIVDITSDLIAPSVQWPQPLRTRPLRRRKLDLFYGSFAPSVLAIRVGLYASLDTNDSPYPIYDDNTKSNLIVPANTSALKVGRFKNGAVGRNLTNHDHFHRRPPGIPEETGIFRNVLRWAFVLDLTAVAARWQTLQVVANPAKFYETHWNRSIKNYLQENGLGDPAQPDGSESRFLRGQLQRTALVLLLGQIGARILVAAGKTPLTPVVDTK